MAFIYIRGKKEPIRIENERARKIKLLRFGRDGEGAAEPSELIDLGDEWAGEIGQIKTIEIEKEAPKVIPPPDPRIEQERERKEFMALSHRERAERKMFWFEMRWWKRSGMKEKKPPEPVIAEAMKLALDWFKQHPDEPFLNLDALEPVLVKYWGEDKKKSLAEQKRVIHKDGE